MALTKIPKNTNEVMKETTIGYLMIAALLSVLYIIRDGLHALGFTNAFVGILVLALLSPLIWVVGHIVAGEEAECVCKKKYYNLFTEWYHKRSCLPFLTRGNFGRPGRGR